MTLTPPTDATVDVDGKHHALATLNWIPGKTERGQVNFPYLISEPDPVFEISGLGLAHGIPLRHHFPHKIWVGPSNSQHSESYCKTVVYRQHRADSCITDAVKRIRDENPMKTFFTYAKHHAYPAWLGAAAFTLCCFLPAQAGPIAVQDSRWVVGSYVNIHEDPDDKSRVIDHLITNTQVRLANENGRYCAITWGSAHEGFIVCRYLGTKPLSLRDVEITDSTENQDHIEPSPLRAFWIEPSYARLWAAGSELEQRMLSTVARKKEGERLQAWADEQSNKPPIFVRFPVPEFEAMKATARNGMLESVSNAPTYPDAKALTAKNPDPYEYQDLSDVLSPKLHYLPAISTYRFRSATEIGAMLNTTEQLSALFRIPYKVEATGKPYAVAPNYDVPYIYGSWDVGDVKLSLVKPVYDIGIYHDGRIRTQKTWLEERDHYFSDSEATEECGSLKIGAHLEGRADSPYSVTNLPTAGLLLYFRTPHPLNLSRARIQRKVHTLRAIPKNLMEITPEGNPYQVIVYTVTLEGDASPDFVVVELRGADYTPDPHTDGITTVARYYFVNIAGDWKLLDADSLQNCA